MLLLRAPRLPASRLPLLTLWVLAFLAPSALRGQTGGTCEPVARRAGRSLGCYITAQEQLGPLPRDSALYWHIDAFPTLAAARVAKGPRGTVVHSLGRVWLFTIAARDWRPSRGDHVVVIGPLPLVEAESYTAVYMEGVFASGMHSVVHRHPGVEAWYTLAGEQCLETPEGKLVQRAADPGVMVPGGQPMILTAIGKEIRRSLVLILQDASQPRSTLARDWIPMGLCQP